MEAFDSVNQFMTNVMGIVNQIQINGENIEAPKVVEKVLMSLPRKYEMVVIAIIESKYLEKFSIEELIGS